MIQLGIWKYKHRVWSPRDKVMILQLCEAVPNGSRIWNPVLIHSLTRQVLRAHHVLGPVRLEMGLAEVLDSPLPRSLNLPNCSAPQFSFSKWVNSLCSETSRRITKDHYRGSHYRVWCSIWTWKVFSKWGTLWDGFQTCQHILWHTFHEEIASMSLSWT